MTILIAYGTSEGQTRKIATALAARAHKLGQDAHLFDTASLEDIHPNSYDKVLVAGSVHDQRHQESLEIFVMTNMAELQRKPTIFLSVSLSAAFSEGIPDAQGYADDGHSEQGLSGYRYFPRSMPGVGVYGTQLFSCARGRSFPPCDARPATGR